MDEIQFSAADIRVFLAEHLPYYETEDKDDFLYIAKASDIERVALELYRHLTSSSSLATEACTCPEPVIYNWKGVKRCSRCQLAPPT